ncbi:MAG: orotidine-5'-phosphate decarboxylase [Peptococcaceae bacterium]|jgi:orotidine-5'-phosphate decarboxylase|nr:orotidine-5'-phosphate decarboxylase [Peptococcaceae bacterium]MDH7526317.1 orotidine-5'-phosphate decarboxylase [Peptococcaceae bacterium]
MNSSDPAAGKLIVALDFPAWEEAGQMVDRLPEIKCFKVGLELYLASGGKAVAQLRERGKEVFLDLKFHDIPNTVAQASRQAVLQGAAIFNVHAAGGREMMERAALAAREEALRLGREKPLLVAVTVLTSLNENDLRAIGLNGVENTVARWARMARQAGLDGVVASPGEIRLVKESCGSGFLVVCPGVRPAWAAQDDQQRILTPGEAIKEGADYLVVGRPITRAVNPRQAALRVLEEIEAALAG